MTMDERKSLFESFVVIMFNGGARNNVIIWIAKKDTKVSGETAFKACVKVLEAAQEKRLKSKRIFSVSDLPVSFAERVQEVLKSWNNPEFALCKGGKFRDYY